MLEEDFCKTEKNCIKYTIGVFSRNPSMFLGTNDEKHIKRQYDFFKSIARTSGINFKDTICLWDEGRALYNKYESAEKSMSNFVPPFRVGRKQKRAIVDSEGHELVIFAKGLEEEAQKYCDFLNANK